ncbi:hypothetical protein OUZ56_007865 [Daphnia magna]|uniref:Uncharacterized protein n=1 Tax=Daphnia magna TaxID=35525 RepID=A0ABR0AB95_9CRUS|nr:hypothetical protein OUZ56_007865 [Daphnia magna]
MSAQLTQTIAALRVGKRRKTIDQRFLWQRSLVKIHHDVYRRLHDTVSYDLVSTSIAKRLNSITMQEQRKYYSSKIDYIESGSRIHYPIKKKRKEVPRNYGRPSEN